MENLNRLACLLGAENELMIQAGTADGDAAGYAETTVTEDGYYYAYYEDCESTLITVTNPNTGEMDYTGAGNVYLLSLGYLKAGQTATVQTGLEEDVDYYLYRLDLSALDQAYEALSGQTMEIASFSSTEVAGIIEVTEAGDLFLSIPAEEGWTLYVDGEETEWTTFKDAFITVPLSEGVHEIRLVYHTPGLLIGGIVSATCILAFLSIMIAQKCRRNLPDR